VRRHHLPASTRKDRDAVYVTHVGDVLARALQVGWGGDRTIPRLDPGVAQELGLAPDGMDRLIARLLDELRKAKDFFEMIGG